MLQLQLHTAELALGLTVRRCAPVDLLQKASHFVFPEKKEKSMLVGSVASPNS